MPFGSTIAQLRAPVIPGQQFVAPVAGSSIYDGPLPMPADPNEPWARALDTYPGNNAEAFLGGNTDSLQLVEAASAPKVFDPVAWDVSHARRSAEADQTERALVGQRLQADTAQARDQFRQAQSERLANELDRATEKRLQRLANPDDPFSPLSKAKARYDFLAGAGQLSNRQERELNRLGEMLNQQAGRAQQMLQGAANLRQREDVARKALIEAQKREQTGMPIEPLPTPDDAEQAIRWVDEAKHRALQEKMIEQAAKGNKRDLQARKREGQRQFDTSVTASNSLAREKKAWMASQQERMDKEALASDGTLDSPDYRQRVSKWKRSPEYAQALEAIDTARNANELRRDAYQPPAALWDDEQAILEEALRRYPDTPSQTVERMVRKGLGIPER
jgi:hypothetical protein